MMRLIIKFVGTKDMAIIYILLKGLMPEQKPHEHGGIMSLIAKNDLRPHSLSLSFASVTTYRSRTGGCISILLLITIITIFCLKMYDVLNKRHIMTQSTVNGSDYSSLNLFDLDVRLYFHIQLQGPRLLCNQLYEHGVNMTIQTNYIYRANNTIQKQISYGDIGCRNNGDFVIPQKINKVIFGRVDLIPNEQGEDEGLYRRIAFKMTKCNKSVDIRCGEFKNNLFPFLIFTNHEISLGAQSRQQLVRSQKNQRIIESLTPLVSQNYKRINIYFSKINILTDESVLPELLHDFEDSKKNNISTWLYDEEYEVFDAPTGETVDQIQLMNIAFKRSIYTYNHERSYKKIDAALSQVFGMLGLLFLVQGLLYSGYNQWSFKQLRLREMGLPYHRPNICRFYWLSLNWFCHLVYACVCCRRDTNTVSDTADDEQYLDYRELLRKVSANETVGKSEIIAINDDDEEDEDQKQQLAQPGKDRSMRQRDNLSIQSQQIQESLLTHQQKNGTLVKKRHTVPTFRHQTPNGE